MDVSGTGSTCGMLNIQHKNLLDELVTPTSPRNILCADSVETLMSYSEIYAACSASSSAKAIPESFYMRSMDRVWGCVKVPVEALCLGTGRRRCWTRPARWGWPEEAPPYGTAASCPDRSPGTSRTARCEGTMGPEFRSRQNLIRGEKKNSRGRLEFKWSFKQFETDIELQRLIQY